jgi:hypothetical protein
MVNDKQKKLLATEMGFWWICLRKTLQDKVRKDVIREDERSDDSRSNRWTTTDTVWLSSTYKAAAFIPTGTGVQPSGTLKRQTTTNME